MRVGIGTLGNALRAAIAAAVASLACATDGPRAGRVFDAGPTRLVGTYQYLADAGLFTDCRTGARLPVATEAENAALERAYLEARGAPGEALIVTVTGRIEKRPHAEGTGTRDFLIVNRFEQIWPSETCETSTIATPLEDTYWRLVALDGAPLNTPPEPEREIHIRLASAEKRMTGFAGCNSLMGSYEAEEGALVFGPLATTRMACPALDREVAFTRALEGTRRFRVLGESLVLSGDSGDLLWFEAIQE
jgi:heat shock protein HslJ